MFRGKGLSEVGFSLLEHKEIWTRATWPMCVHSSQKHMRPLQRSWHVSSLIPGDSQQSGDPCPETLSCCVLFAFVFTLGVLGLGAPLSFQRHFLTSPASHGSPIEMFSAPLCLADPQNPRARRVGTSRSLWICSISSQVTPDCYWKQEGSDRNDQGGGHRTKVHSHLLSTFQEFWLMLWV